MAATATLLNATLRSAATTTDAAAVCAAAIAHGSFVTATRAARDTGHTTAEPEPASANAALDAVAQDDPAICSSAATHRLVHSSARSGAQDGGADLDTPTSTGASPDIDLAEPTQHACRVQGALLARGIHVSRNCSVL